MEVVVVALIDTILCFCSVLSNVVPTHCRSQWWITEFGVRDIRSQGQVAVAFPGQPPAVGLNALAVLRRAPTITACTLRFPGTL